MDYDDDPLLRLLPRDRRGWWLGDHEHGGCRRIEARSQATLLAEIQTMNAIRLADAMEKLAAALIRKADAT